MREGNWTCVKEVLGWTLGLKTGMVTLPERKLRDLIILVDILATQLRMDGKDLELLIRKLFSMHLMGTGAVDHLFHIQNSLNQGGVDQAWLPAAFH